MPQQPSTHPNAHRTHRPASRLRAALALSCLLAGLAGCNSTTSGGATGGGATGGNTGGTSGGDAGGSTGGHTGGAPIQPATNTSDNVKRSGGSGRTANAGFSTALAPQTRTAITAPNATFGDANALARGALSGAAPGGPSPIEVLTFDSGTGRVGTAAGSYTGAGGGTVTIGGKTFSVAPGQSRFAGRVLNGGDNLIAGLVTPDAQMPGSGRASFNGTGDVIYVNGPTSQVFTGEMKAKVSADFGTGKVGLAFSAPNGQIDGTAYTGPGRIDITNLTMTGGRFHSDAGSAGSVSGFTGAAGLNSGKQKLDARGFFAGAGAAEAAAVAKISDGANGQAILRMTATR